MNTKTENDKKPQKFTLEKIYIKDLSFESPTPVEYFTKPLKENSEVKLEINTDGNKINDDIYEVVLTITLTATTNDTGRVIYLIEIKQAGIFALNGFEFDDLSLMMNTFCANILFPYAREAISNVIEKGGFPQFLLAPINFDALYQRKMQKSQSELQEESKLNLKH